MESNEEKAMRENCILSVELRNFSAYQTTYCYDDQIKDLEMNRTYITNGREEKSTSLQSINWKT
jgi:hypothetical protein